jgi:hypothetical protein
MRSWPWAASARASSSDGGSGGIVATARSTATTAFGVSPAVQW